MEKSPEYTEELYKRIALQIEVSKKLIAASKAVVAKSKEQYRQHLVETEVYIDAIKIKK